jgi:hypothetical protein
MAKQNAEHDINWRKFFIPLVTRKMGSKVIIKNLGEGTIKDCLEKIKDWYKSHKNYKDPARLVCFTGGVAEIIVNRSQSGITLDSPKIISPFIDPPRKRIPPNGFSAKNPSGIDWHNDFSVIAITDGIRQNFAWSPQAIYTFGLNAKVFPWVFASGSIMECKKFIEIYTRGIIKATQSYTLLSMDGQVYLITAKHTSNKKGLVKVTLGQSENIKSWPLPILYQ